MEEIHKIFEEYEQMYYADYIRKANKIFCNLYEKNHTIGNTREIIIIKALIVSRLNNLLDLIIRCPDPHNDRIIENINNTLDEIKNIVIQNNSLLLIFRKIYEEFFSFFICRIIRIYDNDNFDNLICETFFPVSITISDLRNYLISDYNINSNLNFFGFSYIVVDMSDTLEQFMTDDIIMVCYIVEN